MSFTLDQFILMFITSPLFGFSCIPVFISIIALSRITDATLFAYLKFEMIFIFVDCLINSFNFLGVCDSCFSELNKNILCFIDYYIFYYAAAVLEMESLLMSIFAALSCLFMIDSSPNRLGSLFGKLKPGLAALVLLGLSAFTFSYELFVPVPVHPKNFNSTYYYCDWDTSFQSPLNRIFILISFSISYGLLVIVLIFINCCILFKVRRNFANKQLASGQTSVDRRKTMSQKLTKLIILDCCNFVIGRFPNMIYYSFGRFFDLSGIAFPFIGFSTSMMPISFNIKFIIFYKVNSKFKAESKRVFLSLLCCFRSFNFNRFFMFRKNR